MTQTSHRVAIVVFCEAEGVDEFDAGAAARMAISRVLHQAGRTGPDAQEKVPSTRAPSCPHCGARAGVDDEGLTANHVLGESFFPDPDPDAPDYRPEACEGTGRPPRPDTHPIIGFDRPDGVGIYARVHETMEAGMALGNGYLWTHTTPKAYRP